MGRVRFRGRDSIRSIFLKNNVDPGPTKDVDPGTYLTWQNHVHLLSHTYGLVTPRLIFG